MSDKSIQQFNEQAAAEMWKTSPALSTKIFTSLGITMEKDEDGKETPPCTGRPGIVYVTTPDGERTPLSFEDEHRMRPSLCRCEHEGFELIAGFYKAHVVLFAIQSLLDPDFKMPKAEDFCYAFTDEAEEKTEVATTDQADAVIDFVKGL